MDSLINNGQLAGSLTGGRQEKAVYIPTVYTKAQEDWIDSFFKQNGYLGKLNLSVFMFQSLIRSSFCVISKVKCSKHAQLLFRYVIRLVLLPSHIFLALFIFYERFMMMLV